jgi:predicted aminopeptidase
MRRTHLIALAATAIVLVSTARCSPAYIIRAGIEEARILGRRQPIERLVADPATAPETRRKLQLVLQARTFADQVLKLDVGDSYTTYSWIDRDTLALVVTAAHPDRMESVTWWFPIVGRVPYKGFFSLPAAETEAARQARRGFDTSIRTVGAFSTLGWFNDPLLSTLLRADDVPLASTVIHELVHNTIFIPGQVAFNESFASFVGDRGAILFFCALEGDDGERCRLARDLWHDNLGFSAFLNGLLAELDGVYLRDDLTREQKIALREPIFTLARERYRDEVVPTLRTRYYAGWGRGPINNATLVSRRLYHDRLDLFDAVLHRFAGDLPATIAAIIEAAERQRDDPFAAVARLAVVPGVAGP